MKELDILSKKYNRPAPRYTSYPTVPHWYAFNEADKQHWQNVSRLCTQPISLYIHLPFCESLCTYCGCNKRITTNHAVEEEYIDAALKEWQLYCNIFEAKPTIQELHLGGGTPTFFSPKNLQRLLDGIFANAAIHAQPEFSFEGHPNNTSIEHLQALRGAGFTRVSYGVQDNDHTVQTAINRLQPFSNVKQVTYNARRLGYSSVNFDLIYGLPFQTMQSIQKTIAEVITLKPDRIAFYSYAHVPWKQKAQRLFDEKDLPCPTLKMQLYMLGKKLLTDAGYVDIGMDHFALPHDVLYKAHLDGTLHRNFMGYTTTHTKTLLGLGVSAISDAGDAYAQNHKELENYYQSVNNGMLPLAKGYFLTDTDKNIRQHILNLICKGQTQLDVETHVDITELEEDGLVEKLPGDILRITAKGKQFTRNICNTFDMFELHNTAAVNKQVFSNAI